MIPEDQLIAAGWEKEVLPGLPHLNFTFWNKEVGRTRLTWDPDDGAVIVAACSPYKTLGVARSIRELYSFEEVYSDIPA